MGAEEEFLIRLPVISLAHLKRKDRPGRGLFVFQVCIRRLAR